MKIIGLGHYSRTGKDTFANRLIANLHGTRLKARKIPFAWKLKQICHDLYGWAGMREPEFYDTPEGERFRDIVLTAIGKTPVQIWVDFGTPAVREQVYDRTWIDYLLKTDQGLDVLVVPDVRFPNEVSAILELEGILYKVVRPSYGPRKTVADRALVGWDGWHNVIGGVGTMDSLYYEADRLTDHLLGLGPMPTQTPESRRFNLAVEQIVPWEPLAAAA